MNGEHFCWALCCDLGPHACICGNDCTDHQLPEPIDFDAIPTDPALGTEPDCCS